MLVLGFLLHLGIDIRNRGVDLGLLDLHVPRQCGGKLLDEWALLAFTLGLLELREEFLDLTVFGLELIQ